MESHADDERLEDLELYRLDYEEFQPGDHVYMFCNLYQHHGIVLENSPQLLIAEFTNVALAEDSSSLFSSASTASRATTTGVQGGFRIVHETEPSQWHKVKYQANPLECMTWRPGTCSAAKPSPVETILLRVQFLRDCRHLIPQYHILASNCETVAVWCTTGTWETAQGGRALQISKIGALTSMALLPVPGIGVAAGSLAIWHSMHIGKQWQQTKNKLDDHFEWYAMGKHPKDFSFEPTITHEQEQQDASDVEVE